MVKPSQLTPENAYVFAQIVEEVGLPAGVFNLVNGRGSVIGHELAANPKVGMVSLTGSVSAGQQTMAAAAPNITKVSLELGGKAPAIVMEDADIDLAVKSIIASRVINTGQVCNCAERVYVDKKIKDIFMEKLVAGMKQVKVGNPNEIADLYVAVIGSEQKDISSNLQCWIVPHKKWISYGKRPSALSCPLSNIRISMMRLHGQMTVSMD